MNVSILLGHPEAQRRRPHGSGVGRGPDHSGEADLALFPGAGQMKQEADPDDEELERQKKEMPGAGADSVDR